MISPKVQLMLYGFCFLVARTVSGKPDWLKTKWSPINVDSSNPDPLWSEITLDDITGILIADNALLAFTFDKQKFDNDRRSLGAQTAFYEDSDALKEGFLKPLFEGEEWEQHKCTFRKAIIVSRTSPNPEAPKDQSLRLPSSKGFVTYLARQIALSTGVAVEWKPAYSTNSVALTLIYHEHKGRKWFDISMGRMSLFKGTFMENGLWASADFGSSFDMVDDSPNYLTLAQTLWKDRKGQNSEMAYVDENVPLSQEILYEWPGADDAIGRLIYRHDGSSKPIDIFIIIATVENAWALMLPTKLVQDFETKGTTNGKTTSQIRKNDWFKSHIKSHARRQFNSAIREFDINDDLILHGQLVQIAVVSHGKRLDKLQNKALITAILEELWEESNAPGKTQGPLQGKAGVKIPFLSFLDDKGLRNQDESQKNLFQKVMSPLHYFVVETKANLGNLGVSSTQNAGAGTTVQFLYYGRKLFSFAVDLCPKNNPPMIGEDYTAPDLQDMNDSNTFVFRPK